MDFWGGWGDAPGGVERVVAAYLSVGCVVGLREIPGRLVMVLCVRGLYRWVVGNVGWLLCRRV